MTQYYMGEGEVLIEIYSGNVLQRIYSLECSDREIIDWHFERYPDGDWPMFNPDADMIQRYADQKFYNWKDISNEEN